MKYLPILLLILISAPFLSNAQQVQTQTTPPILLNVPVPSIFLMTDTTTTRSGAWQTSTALLKRRGFVLYTISSDTLNNLVSFKYLDENMRAIDTTRYKIWLDTPRK